jgi:Protein of unknown function (DUF2842)
MNTIAATHPSQVLMLGKAAFDRESGIFCVMSVISAKLSLRRIGGKRSLAAGPAISFSDLRRYVDTMKLRTRKLLGTIYTIVFMVIYALILMAVGGIFIIGRGLMLELPFYILAGFGWLPVAMLIIRWMSKPDATH